MAPATKRANKHYRLEARKIKRAKEIFRAKTETEAIERALDLVISEHERNELIAKAHERFLRSGIQIKDVFGALEH